MECELGFEEKVCVGEEDDDEMDEAGVRKRDRPYQFTKDDADAEDDEEKALGRDDEKLARMRRLPLVQGAMDPPDLYPYARADETKVDPFIWNILYHVPVSLLDMQHPLHQANLLLHTHRRVVQSTAGSVGAFHLAYMQAQAREVTQTLKQSIETHKLHPGVPVQVHLLHVRALQQACLHLCSLERADTEDTPLPAVVPPVVFDTAQVEVEKEVPVYAPAPAGYAIRKQP